MGVARIVDVRRVAALLTALVVAAFALLAVMSTASASAKPYAPSTAPYPPKAGGCVVSTTTAHAGPGDQVTFVGSGFKPGQTVTISVPSASATLGSLTTNAGGAFTGTFTWPASITSASAVVQASAPSATCSFTLVNHDTASTNVHRGSPNSGTQLSSTGFEALAATTVALVLIGSGAIFLGLARRKRA